MKIKVCGITSFEQMQGLQNLGADYAGMIFYEASTRYIGTLAESEKRQIKSLSIKRIGVFVNAEYETILKAITDYNLYGVQLHGDETDEICLELMDKAKVIKVFRIADQTEINSLVELFSPVCHYFLFDTDTAQYGGSGKQFDWSVLEKAAINRPFFLSGGIGLEDVEKVNEFNHPLLHAVDVNSRLESAPGIKDMTKVEQFIKAINHE